jgi:hypothetical protein
MGYASTLEVIRERLDEALAVARSIPDDPMLATDTQRVAFEPALSSLLNVVCEARSYLDIATDPALDLAQKLLAEQRNSASLSHRAYEATVSALKLKASLDEERSKSVALAEKLAEAKSKLHRTEKALEKAYKDNPGGVLGAYSGGTVRPLQREE